MSDATFTFDPKSAPGPLSRVFLSADWLMKLLRPSRDDRRMDAALSELSKFEDYQLADIGLCRSDLYPEGLATAGRRRSRNQSMIGQPIKGRAGEIV